MEFKAFNKIPALDKVEMTITQKIHGSNAQVVIAKECSLEADGELIRLPNGNLGIKDGIEVDGERYVVRAGSRNRWISVGDDNYGFAAFVEAYKEEFIRKLGVGQHFGEWCGIGINSGEGLNQKAFVLFDWWKYPSERELPPQTTVVPVLYNGTFDFEKIEEVMLDLKTNGSKLCPGFMRPEGVVISVMGHRLKKVFEAEETKWTGGCDKAKTLRENNKTPDFSKYAYLLQPLRMEKLLSRDEKYLREYPASLPQICADYVADLTAEGEISGDESEVKMVRKALGGELFKFAKECVSKQVQL